MWWSGVRTGYIGCMCLCCMGVGTGTNVFVVCSEDMGCMCILYIEGA